MADVLAEFDIGVDLAFEKVEAVRIGSLQDLGEEITRTRAEGGKMRVDTGFLRASMMVSTATMPLVDEAARPDGGAAYTLPSYEAAIITSTAEDTVYFGFTAAYAAPREFKDGFVEAAFLNWNAIVSRNEEAARASP